MATMRVCPTCGFLMYDEEYHVCSPFTISLSTPKPTTDELLRQILEELKEIKEKLR